ncbi:MAG: lipoyl(octanoyl) transferase LipB [Desulfobacteraceae bacterium]|nr:lipoyl(octanoyl) transferase LipB [Desulfobacteraceae bacterium]
MPERLNNNHKRSAVFLDLGILEYQRALELQLEHVQLKLDDKEAADQILLVEHPAVYTLGKRGGRENLVVSEDFLSAKKIDVIQTDRGGNITFHGPGQAVLYPIIDLERAKIGVKDFVYGLEEIMKSTVAEFDLKANRDHRNHGLWVGNKKIGSVGISVKKGICFHGLALNVTTNLTPFSWINPCGLSQVAMTSIKNELESMEDISIKKVKTILIRYFSEVFNYSIKENEPSYQN